MKLIGPFKQIVTLRNLPLRGKLSDEQLEIIENGGILIKDEKFSKTKRKKGIGMGGKKSEEVFHLFDGISLRVIYRIAGTGNFLPE